MKVQSRLLRVLQEKEIMRIGGDRIIPVDVRIIAATNQNLAELVSKGMFRADLYHRLKVLYINLPPLRERVEDIIPLIRYFLKEKGMENIKIDNRVLDKLCSLKWYGNVRELKNTIDYVAAVCDKEYISMDDLPQDSFFDSLNVLSSNDDDFEFRQDYLFILKSIYFMMKEGKRATRQSLSELSQKNWP